MATYHHGDLRRTLIDAAARLLDSGPPSELSLRETARLAGVSHAAPAHHFRDKLGLLTAVATRGFHMLASALEAARSANKGDPIKALIEAGRAYVVFAEQNPGYFAVMFRADLHRSDDQDLSAAAGEAYSEMVQMIEELGLKEQPPTAAWFAWAFVHGVATLGNEGQWEIVSGGASGPEIYEQLASFAVLPLSQ